MAEQRSRARVSVTMGPTAHAYVRHRMAQWDETYSRTIERIVLADAKAHGVRR